jgi:putative transcriptional regulator
MEEQEQAEQIPSLSGLLLVASPALRDPHFRKTILLCSHHNAKDGAFGLVLNRPLNLTLREMTTNPVDNFLGNIPLFYGGPVGAENPVLAGVRLNENGEPELRDFSHITNSAEIPDDWKARLRLYVGHSGWSPGQLENEIRQNTWIIIKPAEEILSHPEPVGAWRLVLRNMDPMLKLLAEAPENPILN